MGRPYRSFEVLVVWIEILGYLMDIDVPWIEIQGYLMGRPYRSGMGVMPWIEIQGWGMNRPYRSGMVNLI